MNECGGEAMVMNECGGEAVVMNECGGLLVSAATATTADAAADAGYGDE